MGRKTFTFIGAAGLAVATVKLDLHGRILAAWLLMCLVAVVFWWNGVGAEEEQVPVEYPPWLNRLGYIFVLVAGAGMCWVGWIGWSSRGDGSMAGLLAVFLPIGVLFLLWLAGKYFMSLMRP